MSAERMRWMAAAGVVLLIAAALRLTGLGDVPPGLYRDEAYYALDALDVLHGHLALYFPANNGREPLFIYLLALSIGALGRTPFAVRLTASFVGIASVAVTMAMGRALFGRRVGLLAGATLAVTLWHVHLSRVGFRAVTLPLVLALAVWQAAEARGTMHHARSRRRWVMAGVWYGLSFYTYTAARFTPLVLLIFGIYVLIMRPASSGPRSLLHGPALAALAALATAAPLGIYALLHPDVVMGRAGQVWLWNPAISQGDPWGALAAHTLRTLGMFFLRGDRIWRHNVPWRPVFDPALGTAFVAGLIAALGRARRDAAAGLVLIWTAAMTLPTLLTEDAPHFLRAVGVLPAVALLPALGIEWMNERISRLTDRPLAHWLWLIGLLATVGAYFGDYARAPLAGYWFERGAAVLGARIRESLAERRAVYLMPELWDEWQPQIRFFVADLVADLDSVTVGLPPASHPPSSLAIFVWPYGDWRPAWELLPAPAEVRVEKGPLSQGDRDPQPFMTYVALLADPPAVDSDAPLARFSEGVELRDVETTTAAAACPSDVQVRLIWRVTAPLGGDYTVFLHYLRDGQRIAQADSHPAGGYYPTSRWRPGDIVHDDHCVTGVGQTEAGRDRLRIGFWQPETGAKLYWLDAAGNPAGDWVEIAPR